MARRLPTAIHYRLQLSRVPSAIVAGALFLLLSLWLGSVWHWRNNTTIWWWLLGCVVVYIVLARAAWRWQQQLPTTWLVWNGVHWLLPADSIDDLTPIHTIPAYKKCSCVLDFQAALLLRLTECTHKSPIQQVRWVWAQAATAPQHWHTLRAVVYAQKND